MELISVYTSEDGIRDGMFHEPYKDWPAALITQTVKEEIQELSKSGRTFDQICRPLMWDAILQAKANRTKNFLVLENTAIGTVWIQPNDLGGLTIMKPSDY